MVKRIILLLPLLGMLAASEDQPFEIEIRPRIIDGAKVIVNVDVNSC